MMIEPCENYRNVRIDFHNTCYAFSVLMIIRGLCFGRFQAVLHFVLCILCLLITHKLESVSKVNSSLAYLISQRTKLSSSYWNRYCGIGALLVQPGIVFPMVVGLICHELLQLKYLTNTSEQGSHL